MKTPEEYGLEHSTFRPHQAETIEWAYDNKSPKIMEAPTGSGKTAIARALAERNKVVALMRTKALQEDNYAQDYNFVPLYGRSNYPCLYELARQGAMGDECAFSDEGMSNCPQCGICPYVQAREMARASDMSALNYAYWLHSYKRWPAPDILICDEAHELSNITLEWAGCTITDKERREWELPPFPILRSGGSIGILTKSDPVEQRAYAWLQLCRDKMHEIYSWLQAQDDTESRKNARKAETFGKKIRATMDALNMAHNDWYIRSGPNARPSDRESSWGFVARPLTAKHHFQHYFANAWQLLLMSATIGNIDAFSQELGLSDVDFRRVPSSWLPDTRPVQALDVPRMGQKSTDKDWNHQADAIAKAIKSVSTEWSGLVHVTAIEEASRLAKRLGARGLEDRIYVAKRTSTNAMVADWRNRLRKFPNSIMVTWALWEGYNGLDEKINIAAKVPYPYLGDPYEIERRNYNGSFFLQRAAWQLEQGLGRTRRGRIEDYDTANEQRGLVAVADGGYKWLRKYLSPTFMESLRG